MVCPNTIATFWSVVGDVAVGMLKVNYFVDNVADLWSIHVPDVREVSVSLGGGTYLQKVDDDDDENILLN